MWDEQLVGALDFDPARLKVKYERERDRRIRPDAKQQYVGTSGRFARFSEDPWADPGFAREPLTDHTSVVIAGGGFGGLVMGARLREAGVTDIRIIEIGGDFGGTWYWNRYPGAMCDIEAHIYLPLLEELGYAPKHRYSYAAEMLEVSQRIGKEYGLYDKACFQTSITGAKWVDEQSHWRITTDRGDEMTADFFILACGRQSLPKLPNLPGIESFAGHIFHTSRWDYDYTGGDSSGGMTKLADKKVGIIGTGATALQVVPEVAKDAGELVVFQRTPSTVGVRGQCETGPDWIDMSRPGWQRERRENFQAHVQFGTVEATVKPEADLVADGWTDAFGTLAEPFDAIVARLGRRPSTDELAIISEINDFRLMNRLRARVDEVVDDPRTAEALKPWYRWWCKRPGWHDEYLEAFNRDNVGLIDTEGRGIEGFTERGVLVGGTEYELDCVIMATGFEANIAYTHLTGFDIEARGRTLSEHWTGGVRTLHGMSTDRFPNLFFIGGNPQTASAVNAVHLLDEQAHYVAHVVAETTERRAATVEARPADVEAYVEVIKNSPKNKAMFEFYAQCTPGYYNAEGKARGSEDLFTGGRYGDGALAYYKLLRDWAANSELAGYTLDKQAASS
ncbi:monooxygenase [Streptomyces sp. WAC 05977]|nr:monooxygenase [Streptomyces sp. WAC 05977]